MALKLKIVSPEKIEFDGEVTSVALPGDAGRFEILENHAPFISSLKEGLIEYALEGGKQSVEIQAGFISVKDNVVEVCIEKQ